MAAVFFSTNFVTNLYLCDNKKPDKPERQPGYNGAGNPATTAKPMTFTKTNVRQGKRLHRGCQEL